MHVDGFRFDLASILSRDESGRPLENPPILWDIESDPGLADAKLVAEAWDAAGLYQVGSFMPSGRVTVCGRVTLPVLLSLRVCADGHHRLGLHGQRLIHVARLGRDLAARAGIDQPLDNNVVIRSKTVPDHAQSIHDRAEFHRAHLYDTVIIY